MNWNTAPNNRWSFQHMQALFPTNRLVRSSGIQPFIFPTDEQNIEDIPFELSNGEKSTVRQMLEHSYTDSFLVAKSGVIVLERYFNNMNVDSMHLLNSVTKSFIGMLAGIAVSRGLLDPQSLVTDYLPELSNSAWEGTSVRHLLDMTAGADYGEDYTDVNADFWKEASIVGWKPELVDHNTPDTLRDFAKSLEGKDQNNGERFHYKTVTTNVIGMILEQVMGHNLGNLLSEELWSKLAPSHDANVVVDRAGGLYVGAGMSACARDLVRFGMMLTNGGQLDGRQIVPTNWIEDTIAGEAHSASDYAASEYAALGLSHYRNQVWVKDSAKQVMLALGIHGQIIYADKLNDIVIVKLSTQPASVELPMFVDAFSAMDAIAETLSAQTKSLTV
jgi:hypothetical protein